MLENEAGRGSARTQRLFHFGGPDKQVSSQIREELLK
jgi:hypothetical protein